MTTVHLDTSFLIRALVPDSPEDRRLRSWISSDALLGISAVVWAEFACGPVSDDDRRLAKRIVGAPLALDEDQADQAAVLFNAGGRRRGSFIDCLTAAAALAAGAQLATSNPSDFRRLAAAGLEVVAPL